MPAADIEDSPPRKSPPTRKSPAAAQGKSTAEAPDGPPASPEDGSGAAARSRRAQAKPAPKPKAEERPAEADAAQMALGMDVEIVTPAAPSKPRRTAPVRKSGKLSTVTTVKKPKK